MRENAHQIKSSISQSLLFVAYISRQYFLAFHSLMDFSWKREKHKRRKQESNGRKIQNRKNGKKFAQSFQWKKEFSAKLFHLANSIFTVFGNIVLKI